MGETKETTAMVVVKKEELNEQADKLQQHDHHDKEQEEEQNEVKDVKGSIGSGKRTRSMLSSSSFDGDDDKNKEEDSDDDFIRPKRIKKKKKITGSLSTTKTTIVTTPAPTISTMPAASTTTIIAIDKNKNMNDIDNDDPITNHFQSLSGCRQNDEPITSLNAYSYRLLDPIYSLVYYRRKNLQLANATPSMLVKAHDYKMNKELEAAEEAAVAVVAETVSTTPTPTPTPTTPTTITTPTTNTTTSILPPAASGRPRHRSGKSFRVERSLTRLRNSSLKLKHVQIAFDAAAISVMKAALVLQQQNIKESEIETKNNVANAKELEETNVVELKYNSSTKTKSKTCSSSKITMPTDSYYVPPLVSCLRSISKLRDESLTSTIMMISKQQQQHAIDPNGNSVATATATKPIKAEEPVTTSTESNSNDDGGLSTTSDQTMVILKENSNPNNESETNVLSSVAAVISNTKRTTAKENLQEENIVHSSSSLSPSPSSSATTTTI